jgi:hypothetical protein
MAESKVGLHVNVDQSVTHKVQRSSSRCGERLGKLRTCQSILTMCLQAGHLSILAHLIPCMCCQLERRSCANLMMKTWALFSRVSSAYSGMSQLTDRNALRDQAFLAMSLLHFLGLLAACQSHFACCRVMVLLLIVRLA